MRLVDIFIGYERLVEYLLEENARLTEMVEGANPYRLRVIRALEESNGNVEDAAAALGMSRSTIYGHMKRSKIARRRYRKQQEAAEV